MVRLSGWKRIGIVVSVAWILGMGIYTFITVDDDPLWLGYREAQAMKGSPKWLLLHFHRAFESPGPYPPAVSPWPETVIVAFGTVLLGWGFAYFVLFLVRWVKRGFISPGNSN